MSRVIGSHRADRHVVLTGATGFVGRHVTARLARDGWRVTALARRPELVPALADGGIEAHRWEAAGGAGLPAACGGARAVVHLAAFLPPDYSDPAHADECLRVNALGTLRLLEAARAAGIADFIYASSANAYAPGDGQAGEDDRLYPARHAPYYLGSKLLGEIYCVHAREAHGQGTTVLRLTSVYGAGMAGGVVAKYVAAASSGEPLDVQDGGRHTMDLVHVSDVAAAVAAVLERRRHGVFNVGSGRTTSVLDLARTVARVWGLPDSAVRVAPASSESSKPGFPCVKIARAERELDYRPIRLLEGIRRMKADSEIV